MKITQSEIVDMQTVLHVELQEEDLDPYLNMGYRRLVQQTSIPGFRKGKAPRRIIEGFLGRERLLSEVIDSMLPEAASRAIEDQQIEAGGAPNIELLDMAPVTFEATVPLKPQVDLGPYIELRVPEEGVEVTDEDVQARLEEMRNGMGRWEPVDRPPQMGDLVTMDAVSKIEDRVLLDVKDQSHLLQEDGSSYFPDLSQHLEGIPAGEDREFDIQIPGDFHDDSVAGKEAHFSVTVKEVKERILPDLDDEFAKGVGRGYQDLAELREGVAADLRTEAEGAETGRYREAAMTALVDGTSFELAEVIVEHEVKHLEQQQQTLLSRLNIRPDDYLRSINSTEDEMRLSMHNDAEERVKRAVALEELGRAEGISVSDDEVEQRVQEILSESDSRRRQPDKESVRRSVSQVLLAEKTMDRLVAITKGQGGAASAQDEGGQTEDTQDTQDDESKRDEGEASDKQA